MDHLDSIESTGFVTDAMAAGAAIAEPKIAAPGPDGQAPFVVVPEGYKVEDLEHLLPKPARKRDRVTLEDASSFIRYFKLHQCGSTIYGQIDPPRFVAVLDDHRKDEPGWKEHTATYACPLSREWNTWKNTTGRVRTQPEFAQFIEDNLPDIIEPAAADMLEIARTLEAKKKVNFASSIRLDNGQVQFKYEEDLQGSSQKGQITVPETFSIAIPVFEGGPRYKITTRLRYRIGDGGQLHMWHDMLRPHKVLKDAVLEVWKEIETETGQTIFRGTC